MFKFTRPRQPRPRLDLSSCILAAAAPLLFVLAFGFAQPADASGCYAFLGRKYCKTSNTRLTYIHVKDYSSARWPVSHAIFGWNYTPNVAKENYQHMAKITSGAQSFTAYNAYYGPGWVGLAYTPSTNGCITRGLAWVQFNDTYGDGYAYDQRKNTTTHELGHQLGLAHSGIGTVMYPSVTSRTNPSLCDAYGANILYP